MLQHKQFSLEVVVNSEYAVRPVTNLDNVQGELHDEVETLETRIIKLKRVLRGLEHGSMEFMDTRQKIADLQTEVIGKEKKIDEIDMVFHVFNLAKNENNELVDEGKPVMYPQLTSMEKLVKTSASDLLAISHNCSWEEVKKHYKPKTVVSSMSESLSKTSKSVAKKTKESSLSLTEKAVDSALDGLFMLSRKLKTRK